MTRPDHNKSLSARQIFKSATEFDAVKTIKIKYKIENTNPPQAAPLIAQREAYVVIKDGIAFTDDRAVATEILVLTARKSILGSIPDLATAELLQSIAACVCLEKIENAEHQAIFEDKLAMALNAAEGERYKVLGNPDVPRDDANFGGLLSASSSHSCVQFRWNGKDEDMHQDSFADENHIARTVTKSSGVDCGTVIYVGSHQDLKKAAEGRSGFKFTSPEAPQALPANVSYYITPNDVPVYFRGNAHNFSHGDTCFTSTFHSGSQMPQNGMRTVHSTRTKNTRHIEFSNFAVERVVIPQTLLNKLPMALCKQTQASAIPKDPELG
ncbi:MAG: hypothetical protein GC136_05910 [Alphaproteobacteria bacterium]|nr:hypothetical protein [Alphaproteobacteria bacterium]